MTAATTRTGFAPRIFGRIGAILDWVLDGLISFSELRRKTAEIERLMALSDAGLAARSLKRDEIVHHVFRDLLTR